jgi:hypothetical protein
VVVVPVVLVVVGVVGEEGEGERKGLRQGMERAE